MKSWKALAYSLIAVAVALFPQPLLALEPTELVLKGNTAYQEGRYEEARDDYLAALKEGIDNGHLYYNLGNCYYRLGAMGRAIASYRRALAELPREPDLIANLALARTQVSDSFEEDSRSIDRLADRLLFLNRHLSAYEMRSIAFWLYVIFWCTVILRGIVQKPWSRTLMFVSLVATLCWSISTFAARPGRDGTPMLALRSETRSLLPAVVVTGEAKAYSGNSTNFQVVFLLHDGVEVQIGETRGEWIEVIIPGDKRGWVKSNEIEVIES